ncbi:unnamed protein product, partial [Ectocarpus fasciculatus]
RIAEERGEANVLVARTRVVCFARLGRGLGQGPLDIELPSREHFSLFRASITSITATVGALMPATAAGAHAYSQLWSLLGRQLDKELRPDTQDLHQVSLKALLVLLENSPPVGAMPRLGISCVRLAGRALCPPLGADGSEAMDSEGASEREYPAMALEHLAAIQDLATRCLRLVFPGSCRKPQPKKRKASRTSGA